MAKGIEKIAAKFCVQDAVYWGNPQNDGFGGKTFDAPIQIKCRWEDKMEVDIGWISTGHPGNIRLTKAQVLVTQDLVPNGYLWLGTLAQLNVLYSDITNPRVLIDAWPIHRFDKVPMVFKTDEFVRIAYLYAQGK